LLIVDCWLLIVGGSSRCGINNHQPAINTQQSTKKFGIVKEVAPCDATSRGFFIYFAQRRREPQRTQFFFLAVLAAWRLCANFPQNCVRCGSLRPCAKQTRGGAPLFPAPLTQFSYRWSAETGRSPRPRNPRVTFLSFPSSCERRPACRPALTVFGPAVGRSIRGVYR
jgi:hypothetical protein